ncbi:MAG TPA: T9SS type A sorting domain-containing protein [Bacteroidota bacterium]|nr:T9SS type A sorting domain-containing protein [Bacteroidota bacterium]
MHGKIPFLVVILFFASFVSVAGNASPLTFTAVSSSVFIATLDHSFHLNYGCKYPITFQMTIPAGAEKLQARRKYSGGDDWTTLAEKTSRDTFNAVEAVRFDYGNTIAYVSAAFSELSDSLLIQIADSLSNPVVFHFDGISKYYDNRNAVVTVSADDWSDWVVEDGRFPTLIDIFRSYNLYVTVGVITSGDYTTRNTWGILQQQLDSGFVEAASHSRTHPATPYSDPVGEVVGSSQDIKNALQLPPLFALKTTPYVYTWIAPYGDYDSTVDSLSGVAGYLAERLYANLDTTNPREYVYGDSALSAWDPNRSHFKPFFPTVELGAPSWGGGDTSLPSLNGLFDSVVAKGDIYHCMWHPQVLYSDRDLSYLRSHLSYISNRNNIWYVNLGHLYLYSLMQESTSPVITAVAKPQMIPQTLQLSQNYPNPFNPSTVIEFTVPNGGHASLKIFNALGQEVATLFDGFAPAGIRHQITFDASRFASGMYFSRLEFGGQMQFKKMVLLK